MIQTLISGSTMNVFIILLLNCAVARRGSRNGNKLCAKNITIIENNNYNERNWSIITIDITDISTIKWIKYKNNCRDISANEEINEERKREQKIEKRG